MEENRIDSKRIRLGKITYFDVDHNGSLVPPFGAYVFMVNVDGQYVNPFNEVMDFPVFDRVPYTNTTLDGEDFGTKIVHVQGDLKNGPCIVLEKMDVGEYFDEEQMSIEMLKEYIMRSKKYFVDREKIFKEDKANNGVIKSAISRRKNRYKKADDMEMYIKFNNFIEECEEEKNTHYTR